VDLFRYGRLPIALPPSEEQQAILEWLKVTTRDLDTARSAAQREIDLLQEYRTRLIADVVTGKLDVREAAAHLTGEEEEPESDVELEDSTLGDEETDDLALEEAMAEAGA
jgi:hypothetical protein